MRKYKKTLSRRMPQKDLKMNQINIEEVRQNKGHRKGKKDEDPERKRGSKSKNQIETIKIKKGEKNKTNIKESYKHREQ